MTAASGDGVPVSHRSGPSSGGRSAFLASRTLRRVTLIDGSTCSSGTSHSTVARAVVSTIRRNCRPPAPTRLRGMPPVTCSAAERTGP